MYPVLAGNQILQIQEEHVSSEKIAFPSIRSLTRDFPYYFLTFLDLHNAKRLDFFF